MSVTKGTKLYKKLCDAFSYANRAQECGFDVVFRVTLTNEYVVEVK